MQRALITTIAVLTVLSSYAGATSIDRQVLLSGYATSAVASEQCGGKALTRIEEGRLARVVRTESGEYTSPTEVADSLSTVRQLAGADCTSATVRNSVALFVSDVLPQLQTPMPR